VAVRGGFLGGSRKKKFLHYDMNQFEKGLRKMRVSVDRIRNLRIGGSKGICGVDPHRDKHGCGKESPNIRRGREDLDRKEICSPR